jgi:hypothetical protein
LALAGACAWHNIQQFPDQKQHREGLGLLKIIYGSTLILMTDIVIYYRL